MTIFCCSMVTLPGFGGPPATWRSYQVLRFYLRYQNWIPNQINIKKTYLWPFFYCCMVILPGSGVPPATWRSYQVPRFFFDIIIVFLTLKNVYKHMLDHCLLLCGHFTWIWRASSYLLEQPGTYIYFITYLIKKISSLLSIL